MRLFLLYIALIASSLCSGQEIFDFKKISKVNSVYHEYNARPYKTGFLFLSNKKSDYLNEQINRATSEPLYHIYYFDTLSKSITLLQFEYAQNFDLGAFDLIGDSSIYFTSSYPSKENYVTGIFISTIKNGIISIPTPFSYNDPSQFIGQPAIDPLGGVIIYSSKKADGSTPTILKKSIWENGKWSEPQTLPEPINSNFSQAYPFLHPSGDLYFCSDRDSTGMNVYKAMDILGDLPKIEKLASFNTLKDDFSFYINPALNKGFLSRKVKGNDEIFEFKLTRPWFENAPLQKRNSYCYTLYDDADFDLDTLPLTYEWTLEKDLKKRGLSVKHCFPGPGIYPITLNIVDTLTNDIFFSQANYDLEISDIVQPFIESPDTVAIHIPFDFHGKNSNLPQIKIEEYHWFINDSIYFCGPEQSHTFNELGEQKIVLGIYSTPNAKGLREKIAVSKKIFVNEVGPTAILPTTLSKTESSNIFEYVSDTLAVGSALPEETVYRIEILRSKIQIPSSSAQFKPFRGKYILYENYIPKDSLYSYSVAEVKNLKDAFPIFKAIKESGFEAAQVKAFLPKEIIEFNEDIEIDDEQIFNAVLRTGAVYFEKNEYKLDASSEATLNKILMLLKKYPQLKIQVSAFTDNSGSIEYNLQLSKKRAKSVVEYFMKQGISSSRLIDVGFGISKPVADNQTEEGKKLNRRVEFETINKYE